MTTPNDEIDAVIAEVVLQTKASFAMRQISKEQVASRIREALSCSGYCICSTSDTREAGLRRAAEIAKSYFCTA